MTHCSGGGNPSPRLCSIPCSYLIVTLPYPTLPYLLLPTLPYLTQPEATPGVPHKRLRRREVLLQIFRSYAT